MMNKISIFISFAASLLAMSCATSIPYTNEESCAIDNMKFSKLQKQEEVFVYYNTAEHHPMIETHDEMVPLCEVPKTAAEKQHVQDLRAELEPKKQYNDTVHGIATFPKE